MTKVEVTRRELHGLHVLRELWCDYPTGVYHQGIIREKLDGELWSESLLDESLFDVERMGDLRFIDALRIGYKLAEDDE